MPPCGLAEVTHSSGAPSPRTQAPPTPTPTLTLTRLKYPVRTSGSNKLWQVQIPLDALPDGTEVDGNGNLICLATRDRPPLYQPGSCAPLLDGDDMGLGLLGGAAGWKWPRGAWQRHSSAARLPRTGPLGDGLNHTHSAKRGRAAEIATRGRGASAGACPSLSSRALSPAPRRRHGATAAVGGRAV